MSKRPPDDEDLILQALLEQVQNAFSENDSSDDEDNVQQGLMVGVCDSLRALMGISDFNEPKVTVVDGGRSPDEPPTERERPSLRVASVNEDLETDEQEASENDKQDELRPKVKVRVLRPEDLFTAQRDVVKPKAGRISLKNEGDSQWVLQGKSDFVYRLFCQSGHLIVVFDDQETDLQADQSIDVQGSKIKVIAQTATEGEFYFIH